MGTNQLSGPVTEWIAVKLREQKERFGLTYAQVTEVTGVPMSTAKRAFIGESGLTIEAFVALARGLKMDPAQMLTEAQKAIYPPADPDLSTVHPGQLGLAAKEGLSRAEQRRRIVGDQEDGA